MIRSRAILASSGGGAAAFSGASLYMDFMSSLYYGKSSSDMTVTRASSAYARTVGGTLTSFASGAARITDFGLLVEESRTNLALQSQTATVSPWTTTAITTAADATTAPDGTTTAESILETVASSQHSINQPNVTASASIAYTISCYVKPIGGRNAHIQVNSTGGTGAAVAYFDLTAGTASVGTDLVAGYTSKSAAITSMSNGWFHCQFTATTPASTTANTVFIGTCISTGPADSRAFAGNTSKGLYVWGLQVEAGSFATSYIPTTTVSVTRAADAISMTGTAFSAWYAGPGTMFCDYFQIGASAAARPLSLSDGTTVNAFEFFGGGAGSAAMSGQSISGSATIASLSPSGGAFNSVVKVAMAIASTDYAMCLNGGTVSTSSGAGALPVSPSQANIGNRADGLRPFNGYIRRIAYFQSRQSNATLQSLTS